MQKLMTAQDIENKAREKGLSVAEVCRAAGVATSTFFRWKRAKTSPSIGNYEALVAAVSAPEVKALDQASAA